MIQKTITSQMPGFFQDVKVASNNDGEKGNRLWYTAKLIGPQDRFLTAVNSLLRNNFLKYGVFIPQPNTTCWILKESARLS